VNESHVDNRFSSRRCPFCGSNKSSCFMDLETDMFCLGNWTYNKNYKELLNLSHKATFPIHRCAACGFRFAKYLPNTDFLDLVYDKIINMQNCNDGSENLQSYSRRMMYLGELLSCLGNHDLKILDYGCGVGVDLKILKSVNIKCIGYEPSRERLKKMIQSDLNVYSDEESLFSECPYDAIICDNVLEHVPCPNEIVGIFSKLSKKDTVLFVSVPDSNIKFFKNQKSRILKKLPLDMSLNPWEHLNYFEIKYIDRLFDNAGFSPINPNINVNIGLRQEGGGLNRLRNILASMVRLIDYAVTGRTNRNPNWLFYKYE